MRISKKLLLAFLLVSVVPLVIGGLIVKRALTASINQYSSLRFHNDVTSVSRTVGIKQEEIKHQLQVIAVAIAPTKDSPEINHTLKKVLAVNSAFTRLTIFEINGRMLTSVANKADGPQIIDSPDEKVFKQVAHARDGAIYVVERVPTSSPDFNQHWGESYPSTPQVDLYTPLTDAKGKTIGVLRGTTDFDGLVPVMRSFAPFTGDDGVLLVSDDNRVLLTVGKRFPPGTVIPDEMIDAIERAGADPKRQGAPRSFVDKKEFFVDTGSLSEWGENKLGQWRFIGLLPYEESTAAIGASFYKASLALLILLSAAVAAALWLARSIGRPIVQLTHSAQAIAHGDYSTRVAAHGSLEAEQLGSAFNAMTIAIAKEKASLEAEITERKSAQQRLAELQRSHEIILNGAADGLLGLNGAGEITFINPAGASIIGATVAELVGEPVCCLFGCQSKTHAECREVMARLTQHAREPLRTEMLDRTGEQRSVEYIASPLHDDSSQSNGYVVVLRDIGARLAQERALQEARRVAEAASQAKSEFLANMSHEIRTPMNGVIGMTELLLDTKLSHVQRDYAETARNSASALLTVINDILDFSKVEAGKLELEYLDMDIRDTIEDVARLLAIQAHAKGLEVVALLDPSLPDLIKGDAGRVRQVLLNLSGNAVKFTETGEVVIECKVVEKDAHSVFVRCEVRDTGIGIPAHRLDSLFQAFTQVDPSTTRKFGGTGLGLSIARRLVHLMDGTIGASSQEGAGSIFWFTARFAISQEAPQAKPAPVQLLNRRVLIVDDNATNRKVMMAQLQLCGLQAVCAESADEALKVMRHAARNSEAFEVALLDHQMPSCDGAELGKIILNDDELRKTRLVLLTSSGQRGDGRMFAEMGFAGYLLKPIGARDLIDCLIMAFGAEAEAWQTKTHPLITRHALRSQRVRSSQRILLAEDNVVNQKVACRIVEKLGYHVDVAPDGRAAVEAWQSGRYALILMDCQMPIMDGYEATREIRARETKLGVPRIPIVALTAHAMKGADVGCTAAGMDDYCSKPIDRNRLDACILRLLAPPVSDATQAHAVVTDPVDWIKLIAATDDDEELARELAILFIESGAQTMDSLMLALHTRDYDLLGEKAHEIKGASANLRANKIVTAAERVETAVRESETTTLAVLATELKSEVDNTIDFLRRKIA